MIRSMTGFGQANQTIGSVKVQFDIRSVNHRHCDVTIRMPRDWIRFEDALKKIIQEQVKRGKIEVFVTVERGEQTNKAVDIDWTLVDGYLQAVKQMEERLMRTDSLSVKDLLFIPDVLTFRDEENITDEQMAEALSTTTQQAVANLVQMREVEGAYLLSDLQERLEILNAALEELVKQAPFVVQSYRAKLQDRIQDLLGEANTLDENRLLTEVAIFADRSNIDEELTRLSSHLQQFNQILQLDEPIGRKLDFLIQEMNREVNTIGSKANNISITNYVVNMKAEMEKIREQVQNIE